MKKIFITTSFLLLLSFAGAKFAAAAYCPGQSFDPYSFVCTDTDTFVKGQLIPFTLYQSRIPLFIGPDSHPWHVVNSEGKVVYTPASTPPTSQPPAVFSWSDEWDGKNDKGKQVRAGSYSIVFSNPMPYNIAPITIEIVRKHEKKK